MGFAQVTPVHGWAVGTRQYRAVMIRILVDNEDDRAAVLAAMDRGRFTDLLLQPYLVAWNHRSLRPGVAGQDPALRAAEGSSTVR